jgi:hypothetical protein
VREHRTEPGSGGRPIAGPRSCEEAAWGTASEELPLLRPANERYFADPEKALRERRPQQEVLGFGGEAVVALLTPIVLSVATDVLTEFSH